MLRSLKINSQLDFFLDFNRINKPINLLSPGHQMVGKINQIYQTLGSRCQNELIEKAIEQIFENVSSNLNLGDIYHKEQNQSTHRHRQ